MSKVISIKKAIKISQRLRSERKSIVLAGGCFDVIHTGHVIFLNKAKQYGDVLFVLLESDRTVRKLKGKNRPINNQINRGLVLSSISYVDFVVMLPELKIDSKYDEIVTKIHPSIIATTVNDPNIGHKKRQAKLINAKVLYVTKRVSDHSTTRIATLTKAELL